MFTQVQNATVLQADPRGAIVPFNFDGVRLGPGRLRDQYRAARDYFLNLPDDDILKEYRQRAGLPAPGEALGGWYSGDDRQLFYSAGDFGNTFGQWLSAFARMAKGEDDDQARDKALRLMAEWARTIEPDGFFCSTGHGGARTYNYDKIAAGLVDIAEYLDNADALRHLETITRWAIANLDRGHLQSPPRHSMANTEWYTLSETLYRAYRLTGEPLYRDFGATWHYVDFWDALAAGKDPFIGHHAYSHVNTLSSAAMAFAVTGERRYFDTVDNAYRLLADHHLYATGGYGPEEEFRSNDGTLGGRALVNPYNWLAYRSSFETPCGTWAAFKLSRYLMSFTGAAHYGDWIERLVYNGIGAALPMRDRGRTFYYSDYGLTGGCKVYHPEPELWPCCSGTFPLAVADYHDIIYFKDAAGLYVNLFIPSEANWLQGESRVRVVQETRFPEEDASVLTIHTAAPIEFALRIRLPGWLAGAPAARLNGEEAVLEPLPGAWTEIRRVWRDGDVLRVTLPMQLAFVPVDTQHPGRAALMFGPVVLVSDQGPRFPWDRALAGDQAHPATWIEVTGEPLTFRTRGNAPERTFHPFYQVGEGTTYWMYHDVRPA